MIIVILSLVAMGVGGLTTVLLYRSSYQREIKNLDSISIIQSQLLQKHLGNSALNLDSDQFQKYFKTAFNIQGLNICLVQSSEDSFKVLAKQDDKFQTKTINKKSKKHGLFRMIQPNAPGTEILYDHLNTLVIAHYRFLAKYNTYLVLRLPLVEFNRPFYIGIFIAFSIGAVLVLISAYFLSKLGSPILNKLESTESFNSALVANSVNPIITINELGIVQGWNKSAKSLLGYTRQEILGKSINLIVPTSLRAEHNSYLKNYLETGKAKIIGVGREVLANHKDGSQIPVFLSVNKFVANDKTNFAGILTDLRSLKLAQEEVQRLSHRIISVQEEERQRIAQELHDDLGNSLLLLKMMIQSMVKKLGENSENEPILVESDVILKYLAEIVETSRNISHDLSPIGLKELGIVVSLNRLLERVEDNTQLRVEKEYSLLGEIEFSQVCRINTYRIVQETIKNTIKHANAKNLTVQAFRKNRQVYLRLTDDGEGFEISETSCNTGIGIAFMKERASLMNASIEFKSASKKGTEVIIGFKR